MMAAITMMIKTTRTKKNDGLTTTTLRLETIMTATTISTIWNGC
jgi:hypothetical protein